MEEQMQASKLWALLSFAGRLHVLLREVAPPEVQFQVRRPLDQHGHCHRDRDRFCYCYRYCSPHVCVSRCLPSGAEWCICSRNLLSHVGLKRLGS